MFSFQNGFKELTIRIKHEEIISLCLVILYIIIKNKISKPSEPFAYIINNANIMYIMHIVYIIDTIFPCFSNGKTTKLLTFSLEGPLELVTAITYF